MLECIEHDSTYARARRLRLNICSSALSTTQHMLERIEHDSTCSSASSPVVLP
jgi:hypothetical protein